MRRVSQRVHAALVSGLTIVATGVWAPPARADRIVAITDEHGHKIYINTHEPTPTFSFRPLRSGSHALPPAEIDGLVQEAANRVQIDPKLVHAIIQVESEYNPMAVSRKGAMGLMQLIPATAQRFGVANPFDPKQNINGGVTYLRYLLDLFRGDVNLSLAAYNAGENSVLRSGGIPSIPETRNYVRKVTELYGWQPEAENGREKTAQAPQAVIYRYVDAQGVVHFTDGTEF
jgi:hypothetical protein